MSFTAEQVRELQKPLDRSNVKSRTQGGSSVSYVEAYHAENEANRIFGFDAWDRETELTHIGERELDGKWRVYYRAKVRITVRSDDGGTTVREGCGFGSGIDRDIGQAHESALKEAESDAEKRALKTFGNPFGQALYDKTQANVVDAPPPAAETLSDEQWAILGSLIPVAGLDMKAVCDGYKIPSLRELPASKYQKLRDRLDTIIRENEKAAA